MRYAINIEPLYGEMDFYEKIKRVREAGFKEMEFWGWKNRDPEKIRKICEEYDASISAFCATDDTSLCDPEKADETLDWIKKSAETAKILNCDTMIVFPNHFTDHGAADFRQRYSHTRMVGSIIKNLISAAPFLEKEDITLLLEPLHNQGEDAGMSVTDTSEGADIIRTVGSKNVRLLCDFYHMQVMHGNLLPNIQSQMDIVPYVHLADAPDRFEPGTGEINYEFILREMKRDGFAGIVCFEFFPKNDTEKALEAALALIKRVG